MINDVQYLIKAQCTRFKTSKPSEKLSALKDYVLAYFYELGQLL